MNIQTHIVDCFVKRFQARLSNAQIYKQMHLVDMSFDKTKYLDHFQAQLSTTIQIQRSIHVCVCAVP